MGCRIQKITIQITGLSGSFDGDDGIPVMYQALVLQKTEKQLNNESIYNFYQPLFSRGDVHVFNSIPPRSSKGLGGGGGVRLLFPIQSTPDDSNLRGKSKKVRVIGSSKKIAGSSFFGSQL